jgi:hypothetical protein
MSGQEASASSSDTEQASNDGESSDRDITIGDIVFDCDDGQADPALVVNIPPKTADEWTAYGDVTVADDNPAYPTNAPVIVISYWDEINSKQSEFGALDEPIPLQDLHNAGVTHYTFPAPRLRHADPETDDLDGITIDDPDDGSVPTDEDKTTETPTSDTDSTDATATDQDADTAGAEIEETAEERDQQLQQQKQELEQFSDFLRDNGVRSEVDDGVVVAEKLGQSYEITLDGEVNGGGAFQDRLEQLASEYTS